jgi:hypothetical protein
MGSGKANHRVARPKTDVDHEWSAACDDGMPGEILEWDQCCPRVGESPLLPGGTATAAMLGRGKEGLHGPSFVVAFCDWRGISHLESLVCPHDR